MREKRETRAEEKTASETKFFLSELKKLPFVLTVSEDSSGLWHNRRLINLRTACTKWTLFIFNCTE